MAIVFFSTDIRSTSNSQTVFFQASTALLLQIKGTGSWFIPTKHILIFLNLKTTFLNMVLPAYTCMEIMLAVAKFRVLK
jgi:hypothetical protein